MLPALLLTVTSCRNLWRRVLWRSSMLVFFSSVCFYFVTTSWIAEIGSSSLVLILPQKYSFIGTIWPLGQLRHTVHNYDSLSRLLRGQLLKEGSCWKRAAVERGQLLKAEWLFSFHLSTVPRSGNYCCTTALGTTEVTRQWGKSVDLRRYCSRHTATSTS